MKALLFALAAAGVVATGAATASTIDHEGALVRTQYGNDHDRYDRWDNRAANIDQREARIRERIERGIHDGRITEREAHRLFAELRSIEHKERDFKSDGRIDRRENERLTADLDRLASDVRREMHDDQRY